MSTRMVTWAHLTMFCSKSSALAHCCFVLAELIFCGCLFLRRRILLRFCHQMFPSSCAENAEKYPRKKSFRRTSGQTPPNFAQQIPMKHTFADWSCMCTCSETYLGRLAAKIQPGGQVKSSQRRLACMLLVMRVWLNQGRSG